MAKKSKREIASANGNFETPLTVADVALKAGVSPITVSRALHRPELVNDVTRQHVLEVVRDMGYVPNLLAGSLASSRSRLVAIVLPTIANSIFAGTVQAIMDRLTEAGYQSLLGPTGYSPEKEEILLEAILGRRPDGIVLTGTLHTEASRKRLASAGIPVVEAWDLSETALDIQVGFSHEAVGKLVADHFFAKGYRRFAVITVDDPRGIRRCNSLIERLKHYDLHDVPVEILPLPATWEVGREGFRRLQQHEVAPQLVFCSSDTVALGVLAEAASQGIRVPQDIAVLGFGDITDAKFAYPALSTVSVNSATMGQRVAEALLKRFSGADASSATQINTGFELIERAST
ncbi:LacI family DNA-binding transcriptional regulator [Pseudomonas corrugata]|uniref:LacI family DNA-binding transcriptional regulator n=1 Tax=Pseudomonas corrugata TaxID=47879 RepID=A0A8B6UX69_9PSED|nr:LacI family DNA-binding transcriptional regulator [Pseudomonas corrugata]AOE65138.1 GntR family transcriptional regulator [Pseudomonas corrugata]MDU9025774.1 LacI family DNA-binding transcriptional regulator [Pseudomonas corrugata]MDU9035598.1 LacI family DNA-binding transcriptional regulator [Pseudomonas corrugata]MDU9040501.1 LacI family DNA-binding transcriptional regulator [Pseudomonas corrugata]QTH16496.1 LacI family DNA-binding transcriptional regulator [Pseudomonas corrugata]